MRISLQLVGITVTADRRIDGCTDPNIFCSEIDQITRLTKNEDIIRGGEFASLFHTLNYMYLDSDMLLLNWVKRQLFMSMVLL